MKPTFIQQIAVALRLATSGAEVFIGQVNDDGTIRADKVPIERGLSTHFNRGMFSDFRWRYRTDSDRVLWWNFSDVTEEMQRAVENYLAGYGYRVHRHGSMTAKLMVDGKPIAGTIYGHGGGHSAKLRSRVEVFPK